MERKTFVMSLAKLMIAAAWADGKLSAEEINVLKDLLFSVEDIDTEDWARLDVYMDSPVDGEETRRLLADVIDQVQTRADKDFVLAQLRRVFEIDGDITRDEEALLVQIETALSAADTGVLSWFSKALQSMMGRRAERGGATVSREAHVEDFVKNPVFYQLVMDMEKTGSRVSLPEQDLRRLSFATGLLAHVANVEAGMSEAEKAEMRDAISADWNLSRDEAELLVQAGCERVGRGVDFFRLTHGFFDSTSYDERKAFLRTLFKVANASAKTSNDEIEAIRKLAKSLKLSHQDFVNAKLSISSEDRKGL